MFAIHPLRVGDRLSRSSVFLQ